MFKQTSISMTTHSMRIINETLLKDINQGKCRPNMESTQVHRSVTTCVMKITRQRMRNCHNLTRKTCIRLDYIKNDMMSIPVLSLRECISLSNSITSTLTKVERIFLTDNILSIVASKVIIDKSSRARLVVLYDMSNQIIKC